ITRKRTKYPGHPHPVLGDRGLNPDSPIFSLRVPRLLPWSPPLQNRPAHPQNNRRESAVPTIIAWKYSNPGCFPSNGGKCSQTFWETILCPHPPVPPLWRVWPILPSVGTTDRTALALSPPWSFPRYLPY